MYHYVRIVANPGKDPLGYGLSVNPDYFEQQIKYLNDQGYQSITPDDLYQAMLGKLALPEKPVLLTFDDGYEDFYTTAFPILKKYNFKATNFVITGYISESDNRYLTWDQIKELDQSGLVTIASHTVRHKNVATGSEAWPEIHDSKIVLEKFLSHPVTAFAYPGGSFNQTAIKLVQQAGYELAFTTHFGIWHNLGDRLTTTRVRAGNNLTMDQFIERLSGKFTQVHKK